jgi:methionine-rich copper-binding protein CopC
MGMFQPMPASRSATGARRGPSSLAALLLVLGVASALAAPRPAQAHANYFKSDPSPGAELFYVPTEVRVWFSEGVVAKDSWVRALDSSGTTVGGGESRVDPSDATLIVLPVAPAGAGRYTVKWHTVSADDGDEAEGSFDFTIGG